MKRKRISFRGSLRPAPQDDELRTPAELPNVVVTAQQAFLTREALAAIADTTLTTSPPGRTGRRAIGSGPDGVVACAADWRLHG